MTSTEQAGAYRKQRGADDKVGNLAWASRISGKAFRMAPAASAADVEAVLGLQDEEKLVWRALRLPRRYTDLEHAGLLAPDDMRSLLRSLVAADVVSVVDGAEAKALIPAELKRLQAELQGKEWRPTASMQARVFRPDISAPFTASSGTPAEVVRVDVPAVVAEPAAKPTLVLRGADKQLKEQFASIVGSLASTNHYTFLGLPETANESAIRNAYVALARDYHPDRLAGTGLANDPESRGYVDVLFKRLGDAHKTLGNGETRARYDRELAALAKGSGSAPSARPRRPAEARQAYLMGESFFKKKDYKTAEMHYRQAAMFDAEEPLILVALAWCIYLNPDHSESERISDARQRLEELVKKYKSAEAAYRLGRVLKDSGDETGAMKRFKEALSFNPDHVDSQREMRIGEARRQKTEGERRKAENAEKSIFNKLFKR